VPVTAPVVEPAIPPRAEPAATERTAPAAVEDALAEAVSPADRIRDALLGLVSERTGYPVEMLGLDLDLEADLGIDSIKRVEILGGLQKLAGLVKPEEMERLSGLKTLGQIIAFLVQQHGGPPGAPSAEIPARPPAAATAPAVDAALKPGRALPLIGAVVSLTPGREAVTLSTLTLEECLFLKDHTFGRRISDTDPGLLGIPVVPLTMSLELMAEAASLLAPGEVLVGMREVRGYRWITVEGEDLTLRATAEVVPEAPAHEFRVRMHDAASTDDRGGPLIEAVMVFRPKASEAMQVENLPLRSPRPAPWTPDRFHEDVMFHGSSFQGVRSLEAFGDEGAEGTIEILPRRALFASLPEPAFLLDPVLMDEMGQMLGFRLMEGVTDAMFFPFQIAEVQVYGPPRAPGTRIRCRVRLASDPGAETVGSDIEASDSQGRAMIRCTGWQDRRFAIPARFPGLLLEPAAHLLSEPWSIPGIEVPDNEVIRRFRPGQIPGGFFSSGWGIWGRALANVVLSRRERAFLAQAGFSDGRRIEWLLGRVAAKDAVRLLIQRSGGPVLRPADIELEPDEQGRPHVRGAWVRTVSAIPTVSISHSHGAVVALASLAAGGVGIDIEPEGGTPGGNGDLGHLAISEEEEALLQSTGDAPDGWRLRMWCGKEAAGKALGLGLGSGLLGLRVRAVDRSAGSMAVESAGGATTPVMTSAGDGYIIAVSRHSTSGNGHR
jgi:phosphopantetheinyl transferase/acyl carrier protein